jgi:putative transposase
MNQNRRERQGHVGKATGLSIVRQCELLEVSRSNFYYRPCGETDLNLELMRLIDGEYLLHPWLGVPRMTTWLQKDKGFKINHKRVERLYRLMGTLFKVLLMVILPMKE